MNIVRKRFTRHIRHGCLPYAYAYMIALYTLIKVSAITVCCYDLAQREASLNQTVLLATAAISCILLTAQIRIDYADLKRRFLQHELIRKSR